MHKFEVSISNTLRICGAVTVAALYVYWRYRLVKYRADRKVQTADIQTIFEGEK